MNRILMIDDDVSLCRLIKKCAQKENFMVDLSFTGADGLHRAKTGNYQLIVLDVMLPEMDGLSVLFEIRKQLTVPVLMLTAKGEESDKVAGLRLGADDYLTKPFSINECMARIGALVRRYTKLNYPCTDRPALSVGELQLNAQTHKVVSSGVSVELTGKEFDLLYLLAAHKGRIFTKKQIYNEVWQDEYAFDDNNIMSFISKLRKKIEVNPNHPAYIQTVRGVGYRFCEEDFAYGRSDG